MKTIYAILLTVMSAVFSVAVAQTTLRDLFDQPEEIFLNGPEDCLLTSTDQCPISFMVKAYCMRDPQVCINRPEYDSYRIIDLFFYQQHHELLFGEPIPYTGFRDPLLTSYPTATLHEMFEFLICYLDDESCYPDGDSGLTIYHPSVDEDYCAIYPTDPDCLGGPTDSAICQITPEACSGSFSGD